MTTLNNIKVIFAYIYFDAPNKKEIERKAQELVGQGNKASSLVDILYGVNDENDYKDTIRNLSKELNIDIPPHKEAGFLLAEYYAESIINGDMDSYEGAKNIWQNIEVNEEYESEFEDLKIFGGLVSEYDDFQDKEHVDFYGKDGCTKQLEKTKESIVEEAKIVIANRSK